MTEQLCDRIYVNRDPDLSELYITFTQDGNDRGGWPPYWFQCIEVRKNLLNGDVEVSFKPIFGRYTFTGPMDERSLELVEPYFDYILEIPGGNGIDDGH